MTDITAFARRLMNINEKVIQSNTPRAIFGSIGDLPQSITAKPPFRIGLWPCVSNEHPEFAMGLFVILAHLLERWRDIRVYRLFVKLADDPDEFDWSIEQSQFEVDDWPVEALDENIAIWGSLKKADGKWELKVSIENDLLTGKDNEPTELVFTADNLVNFIGQLVTIAEKIAENIEAERVDETEPLFGADNLPDETSLKPLLSKLLKWDVQLLASLWGVELEDDDIEDDFEELLEAGKSVQHDMAAWAISKAVAHTMLPGYTIIGDLLVSRVDEVLETFPNSQLPAPLLALAIYRMGNVQEAYKLLESDVKARPETVASWLKLAELYAAGGRLDESLERFQTAIEKEVTSGHLYRAYGNVLLAADQYGTHIEDFVLINVDDIDEDEIIWEAIEAYDKALKANPNDARALYTKLLQMLLVEADNDRVWADFKQLLLLADTGEYIRDVIESMYEIEDIQPGIDAILSVIKEKGEHFDLFINVASLYIVDENGKDAKAYLEKAKSMTDSVDKLADIEHLLLSTDYPEFEYKFGELEAIVNAGNSLSTDDVDFLEKVSEKAPHLIKAHLVLAGAYHTWGDKDAALEVLLDTQEKLPDNPAVIDMLAKILWESDERELAFEYLNKGLTAYPFSVTLLVRTGRYLFDNEQLTQARAYLGRAEEIAPQDPTLRNVRSYIARKVAENPELARKMAEDSDSTD